jgi:GNAT superfamily N-acetyltransferase
MTEETDRVDAADMNSFLNRHAFDQEKKGISRTFVLCAPESGEPQRVLAYYTSSVGHLQPQQMPKVVSDRMTIPIVYLLRLAVDSQHQGNRMGSRLFVHFLAQVVSVADITGVYALVLEPLNDRVRTFYERFGLRPLPGSETHMYVRITDLRAWLSQHRPPVEC